KHIIIKNKNKMTNENQLHTGIIIKITDSAVMHRISNVLRLRIAQDVILFKSTHHIVANIQSIAKQIELIVKDVQHNKKIETFITLCVPVLKRDDLELAISLAVQVGVCAIQLITTERSHALRGNLDLDRLHRLAIAA